MQYPDEEKPIEAEYEIVSSGKERGRDEFKKKPEFQSRKPLQAWKAKLLFWGVVIGSISLVLLLLFFFISLFIYFFVPIMIILGCWILLKFLAGK